MAKPKKKRVRASITNSIACLAIGQITLNACVRLGRSAEQVLKDSAPKPYHQQLDVILEHSDSISPSELLYARRSSAIGYKNGKVVRQFSAIDYTYGVFCQVMLAFYFSLCCICMYILKSRLDVLATLAFAAIVLPTCMAAVHKYFFKSQKTAKEAIKVLEQHSQAAQGGR